ncbi:heme oxygenase [Nocardioides sp. J9]|uniref:biliverdin-producing heme oxygenase n=1 Tax=Nocardioides sp. J9 TaxID=935844 RepID=UPI0011ACB659|nr:biliverdin-producing heme oxygenase [Nocardioides sp. J9]TWH04948.1 heme oxygenase [Nocardioides sp. J9]
MTVVTETPTAAVPLSVAMREGSRSEHEAAENSSFMAELLEGRLTSQAHTDLLLRLRRIYAALEKAVAEHADDELIAPLHDPALERLAAIDADLAHWAPGVDADAIESPAATAYAERIASAEWTGALVAHHYTRYLGDLSGGQVIGRILRRTYDIPEGRGTAFYEFTGIPKPKLFKDTYRAALDALPLSQDEVARVVDEVRAVFALNQALFVELGQDLDDYRTA